MSRARKGNVEAYRDDEEVDHSGHGDGSTRRGSGIGINVGGDEDGTERER